MLRLSFFLFLSLVSLNSYAEVCEGINACTELYSKLTGEKIVMDKFITDEMTLAAPDVNLDATNASKEYVLYMNKNAVAVVGKKLQAMRNGEYLIAPIYIVSEGNMPKMINKDGLVTLVYHAKKSTQQLVNSRIRKMLSKKKSKSMNKIIEFSGNNIVAVSDSYECASKMMKEIMKSDK